MLKISFSSLNTIFCFKWFFSVIFYNCMLIMNLSNVYNNYFYSKTINSFKFSN